MMCRSNRTGHFGKYMNRYEGDHIPAGWHHWSSLILNSKYYNYSMNVNGRRREHGWQYPKVGVASPSRAAARRVLGLWSPV